MATKHDFTPDEWSRIVAGPMVVSMAITAADPSGLWGLLKESMAGGWALLEAKRNTSTSPLAKAVAEDIATSETRTAVRDRMQANFKGAQFNEIKTKAIDEIRQIASILATKAPNEAETYKLWLREVAQKAAEAGREGGFMGFGGVAVSDAERATLDEISAALGLTSTGSA
jgi:hypothetical protein